MTENKREKINEPSVEEFEQLEINKQLPVLQVLWDVAMNASHEWEQLEKEKNSDDQKTATALKASQDAWGKYRDYFHKARKNNV